MAEFRVLGYDAVTGGPKRLAVGDTTRFGALGIGVAPPSAGLALAVSTPANPGEVGMDAQGNLLLFVGGQVTAGVSDLGHGVLRQLIHLAGVGPMEGWPSGVYREITGQPFPTNMTWWTSAAKTTKILELNVTRNPEQNPTVEQWIMYDADGTTVLKTITDAITYSGAYETSRTRTIA